MRNIVVKLRSTSNVKLVLKEERVDCLHEKYGDSLMFTHIHKTYGFLNVRMQEGS